MQAWLKGLVLIALLVALPLVAEQFFSPHPPIYAPPGSTSYTPYSGSLKDCRIECQGDCAKNCEKEKVARDKQDWMPKWMRDTLDWLTSNALGILILTLVLALLITFLFYLPQTYEIAENLTLAEREMNALLRGWGGGMSADSRKAMAKERGEWLTMLPDTHHPPVADVYKAFFDLNQKDLETGGGPGGSIGKARFTAFILREIYEGNVRSAQSKILNELKSGNKPHIVAGLREIVNYDTLEETKKLPDDYIGYIPLILTVKMNRFPRNIIMVRADKTVARNWDVIDELNRQMPPAPPA